MIDRLYFRQTSVFCCFYQQKLVKNWILLRIHLVASKANQDIAAEKTKAAPNLLFDFDIVLFTH
jgi:hypothetical protein